MRYVIFFQPRSGSTYLASRLNSREDGVINGYEIIDRDSARRECLLDDVEYESFFALAKKQVLTRFFRKFGDVPTVGCKVAPYQVADDLPGFFQYALKEIDKAIFLTRENPVQTAISQIWSLLRSRQNQASYLVNGERNSVRMLEIDRAQFEYYVISSIIERDLVLSLSRIPAESLTLSYEEYFAEPKRSFEKVRDFLKIPHNIDLPESNLVKIRNDSAKSYIQNYDEVREWVTQLGFDGSLLDARL